MKSDVLRDISSSESFISYIFSLNSIFDGLFVFTILLAFIIVLSSAIFSWSRDMIESAQYGLFIGTVIAFFGVIIRQDGVSLINGFQFGLIISLLVLISIYKKVTD